MKPGCKQKPETCDDSKFCKQRDMDGKMKRWIECGIRNNSKCLNSTGDWWENYQAQQSNATQLSK